MLTLANMDTMIETLTWQEKTMKPNLRTVQCERCMRFTSSVLVLFWAATGLLVDHAFAAPPSPGGLPNIVLIISDDQAYSDFGFMGSQLAQTPNLDRLASQSARFVNGYVPSSVCRPSLVSILTGLYPFQHKVHFNHAPPGNSGYNRMTSKAEYVKARSRSFELIRGVDTLPRLLHEQCGYRCMQTGKFWEGHYANAGFTDGMTVFEADGSDLYGQRVLPSGEVVAHGNGDRGLTIGRETMRPIFDFVDDCGEQPFMVWYAPFLPHGPHDPPSRFVQQYTSRPEVPAHEVPYLASVSFFDDTVGRLIEFLEERQLAKNTIFVFVVDNGWRPSTKRAPAHATDYEHTLRSKRAPFDDGLRTPILIRWDGHITPATHQGLASSIDIMPTLLAAVGLEDATVGLPGVDLLEAARDGQPIDPNRPVFGDIYPGDASSLHEPGRDIAYRWVRRGRMKLIVPHRHHGKPPWGGYLDGDALFDVVADPKEQLNLIDEANYRDKVVALRQSLDAWWTPDEASR